MDTICNLAFVYSSFFHKTSGAKTTKDKGSNKLKLEFNLQENVTANKIILAYDIQYAERDSYIYTICSRYIDVKMCKNT